MSPQLRMKYITPSSNCIPANPRGQTSFHQRFSRKAESNRCKDSKGNSSKSGSKKMCSRISRCHDRSHLKTERWSCLLQWPLWYLSYLQSWQDSRLHTAESSVSSSSTQWSSARESVWLPSRLRYRWHDLHHQIVNRRSVRQSNIMTSIWPS